MREPYLQPTSYLLVPGLTFLSPPSLVVLEASGKLSILQFLSTSLRTFLLPEIAE